MPAISERLNRAAITVCVMLATIMQALDITIAVSLAAGVVVLRRAGGHANALR